MNKAFSILVKQYRPMLLTYLSALAEQDASAEDLVQETLLTAFEKLESFDPDGNFGAWLRGIARKKALEHYRGLKRRPLVVDSQVLEGMEEVYVSFDQPRTEESTWEERVRLMRRCIEKLSGRLRETFELFYTENHTVEATAGRLKVSFEAVAQRLSRARNQVRRCVRAQMGESL